MAITAVDKIKINKYFREHSIDDIFYLDMLDALAKKEKPSDVEFLDFFVDWVVAEFRKEEKISVKQVAKLLKTVESFLSWVSSVGTNVLVETVDKMRSFKDYYDEYLKRTGYPKDEELEQLYIMPIVNEINRLAPKEKRKDEGPMVNYLNQIQDLERFIKDLDKQLAELEKENKKLEGQVDKKQAKIDELKKDNGALTKELKAKEKEHSKLTEKIADLEKKLKEQLAELEAAVAKLKEEINSLTNENAELKGYQEKYSEILSKANKLSQIIEEQEKLNEHRKLTEEKEKKIKELLYKKLLSGKCKCEDLLAYVKKQGVETTLEEVYRLLSEINEKISIRSQSFSMAPTYQIVEPNVMRDHTFTIDVPEGCKHYDILLVADFHVKDVDGKTVSAFDSINSYCKDNGISLVLNFGDFFNGYNSKSLDYDTAVKNYDVVQSAASKLPKEEGVYHAFLGGNHEANLLKYGYDPISILANSREDFINLGYTHATIAFSGMNSILGKFDIHHPDSFDFPIDLDDNGIDVAAIDSFLEGIYTSQGRTREDSYIDIVGHTHKSQFNYPGSYCFLSSYLKKSAMQLRVYFDDDKKIKYMVFMPIHADKSLSKTNEIIYQKTLSKKTNL